MGLKIRNIHTCQANIRMEKKISHHILFLQELSSEAKAIATLSVVTFVLMVVLAMALLPAAAEWEALALTGSVLVTLCLGAGTLMATHHAPLPLFALILVSYS